MRAFLRLFVVVTTFASFFCHVPEGFLVNPIDNHAYKLMYRAQTWTMARDNCTNMGAKLAVPKSKEQFKFLQQMVVSMKYQDIVGAKYKLLVWLGISNLDNYQIWTNVDGENIADTGFHTWAGENGHTSDNPAEPHCAGMDAMNFGLRDWWCHRQQPYICEVFSGDAGSL